VHPRGHRGGCRLTGASPHAPPGAGWCAAAAQKPAAKKDDKNVKPAKKLPDIPGLDSALFKRAMAEQKANGIEMNGPKIHRLRPACCAARGAWCVCAGGQGAGDPGGVGGVCDWALRKDAGGDVSRCRGAAGTLGGRRALSNRVRIWVLGVERMAQSARACDTAPCSGVLAA